MKEERVEVLKNLSRRRYSKYYLLQSVRKENEWPFPAGISL